MEAYGGNPPEMIPVDITEETVATGADSKSLKHWLLRFGVAGLGLRHIVGEFGDWMDNGRPP